MSKILLQASQKSFDRTTDLKNNIPYCICLPKRWRLFWESTSNESSPLGYDLIYILPQPMTQISGIQFHNFGSAFVSILAANQSQYLNWKREHQSNSTGEQLYKQTTKVNSWCVLWPDTQIMLSAQDLLKQKSNAAFFSHTWSWTCHPLLQYQSTIKGPFYAICVRCRPFYDVITHYNDSCLTENITNNMIQTKTIEEKDAPTVGLYSIQIYGIVQKKVSPTRPTRPKNASTTTTTSSSSPSAAAASTSTTTTTTAASTSTTAHSRLGSIFS